MATPAFWFVGARARTSSVKPCRLPSNCPSRGNALHKTRARKLAQQRVVARPCVATQTNSAPSSSTTVPSKDRLLQPLPRPGAKQSKVTTVYKFGGSSVADADCMRQVAEIICAFPDELPCVVVSAMGKSTNLLLEAGRLAVSTGTDSVPSMKPLQLVKALHRDTCVRLDVDEETVASVEKLLSELQQLLIGLSIVQEVTPRARDSLVSFGERLSTRLLAGYLRRLGVPATQFDAWRLGIVTSCEFTDAQIRNSCMLDVKEKLAEHVAQNDSVPIVTGFLGKAEGIGAITTLGRGGSDLSATFIGAALGVPEVVVWKDVDGVLTCDPRVVRDARVVSELTFDEATELSYFGAQVLHPAAMQPLQTLEQDVLIRVRNSYNLGAPGSLIVKDRPHCDGGLITSIVLKEDVHLLDIVSTRMMGNYGFLARVFNVFKEEEISVDVVATSEISVSVTLDSGKLWSRELIDEELDHLAGRFEGQATVDVRKGLSIISLICDASRSSQILKQVFGVLDEMQINVKMISQGASKTNISLIVATQKAKTAVQSIHAAFLGVQDICAASEAALNKEKPT